MYVIVGRFVVSSFLELETLSPSILWFFSSPSLCGPSFFFPFFRDPSSSPKRKKPFLSSRAGETVFSLHCCSPSFEEDLFSRISHSFSPRGRRLFGQWARAGFFFYLLTCSPALPIFSPQVLGAEPFLGPATQTFPPSMADGFPFPEEIGSFFFPLSFPPQSPLLTQS